MQLFLGQYLYVTTFVRESSVIKVFKGEQQQVIVLLQGPGPTFQIQAPRSSNLQGRECIIARFCRCSLHLHIRYVEGAMLQSMSRNDTPGQVQLFKSRLPEAEICRAASVSQRGSSDVVCISIFDMRKEVCYNPCLKIMLQGQDPPFRICAPGSSHLQGSECILARFCRCSLHLHIRYVEGGMLQFVSRNDTIRVSKSLSLIHI